MYLGFAFMKKTLPSDSSFFGDTNEEVHVESCNDVFVVVDE